MRSLGGGRSEDCVERVPLTVDEDKGPFDEASPRRDAGELVQADLSAGLLCKKSTLLTAVVIQNTAYALLRRYSRSALHERYSTSSVLLTMELVKLVLSAVQVYGALCDGGSDGGGAVPTVFVRALYPREGCGISRSV